MKTVMRLIAEQLGEFGVTHVFGVPGKAISPLIMELDECGIHYVLCRHEGGAGFAAAGFSLGKHSLGVAIGTSGPGGTNMVTAAAQARAFHLPVLFITGHPGQKQSGMSLAQDSSIFGTDLVKIFEPVTAFSARVERAEVFPLYFRHAIEKALCGKRGPVHLSISFDVLTEQTEDFSMELPVVEPAAALNLSAILSLLKKAQSPLLLAGKGVHASQAYAEVRRLAERWQIPVMTTPSGKGSFPTMAPLSLGVLGVGGSRQAYEALRQGSDLLLVLGTSLSDMALAGVDRSCYPKQVVQFDIDGTFIGKSLPVPTIPVVGDLKCNIQKLLQEAGAGEECETTLPIRREATTSFIPRDGFLSVARSMQCIRRCLPEHAIVISDSGSHSFYAVKYLTIVEPGTFYFDDKFGAMGHAIGMSIGTKLALPETPVTCITGDGCLMMHGTEISTAVCHKVPVIFIVVNNGRLDMVEKAMKHNMERVVGAVFDIPVQVSEFALSLGAAAFCCRNESDVANALDFGMKYDGPTVVELLTDPEELPPTLIREGIG